MKKLKSLRHNTVTDWKFCKTYYVINSLKNNDYIHIFVHFFIYYLIHLENSKVDIFKNFIINRLIGLEFL